MFILKIPISKATFSFALFSALVTFMYKAILCLLRKIRKCEDKYNAIIAGSLSSLSIIAEPNAGMRRFISVYVFATSIDSFLRTLESNKIADRPKNIGLYAATLMIGWFMVHFGLNRDVVGFKMVKFIEKAA
mmetsp:Transcript_16961/g.18939  ORF Transcript_16961/g.18939 Transcript_16961/m.18939 type:complete len:132 (+) Transcript_16961:196-591(+)